MDQANQPDLAGQDLLPEEVEEMIRLKKEERIAKIEAFGSTLAKKRDDAIEGRQATGIEQVWVEAEEAYQGIDDANRGEAQGMLKPNTVGGSFIGKPERKDVRSTVFLNITRPYVDAAAAKVADMLLPTDDRNWGIKPTPIPALVNALEDQTPVQQNPMVRVMDVALKEMEAAKKTAEAAEKRIEDWLIECQYHAEVRKVIEDCARLGTGILKGPVPIRKKRRATQMGPGGVALVMESVIDPASKHINPWNFYPDPACGESIHNGQYIWEKDEITARQVKDLIGVPGYLDEQIKKVLEEGPGKKYENARQINQRSMVSDKDKYEIWYWHGMVDTEDLETVGVDCTGIEGGAHSIVTMINDTVIKAALQPLDNGEFPYDLMPWQRRTDVPWGTGVGTQVRTPQRMVNAGTRNMMDNAGVSAGGQFVMRRGAIEPADGSWSITPRKIWFMRDDADARSVNDVFAAIQLPSMQAELMNIIQFAMKMAEDVTGLPQLLQGMQGKAPDTVGGMQMLQNNASSVLRRIARTFDDHITEPHIRRYYQWLMEHGDDPNEKGDFTIDARGSTALVERDIAQQAILGIGQFVMNPAFGLSPAKWMEEALKSQRIDPKRIQLDDEEKQKMSQMQAPEAPQIAVAKIRAETDLKKTEINAQLQEKKIMVDTDRDRVYVEAQTRRDQVDAVSRVEELRIKREIAYLTLQIQKGINVDNNKVKLADTAMRLRVQKELALGSAAVDLHKHNNPQVATPATEPPGRAQPGQAFQQ